MSSPAEHVKDLLVGAHVDLDVSAGAFGSDTPNSEGWLLRVSRLTELPHKQVAVYDTGGSDPNPKWLLDFPTVQVRVRGPIDGYQIAWEKAQQIKDLLLGLESRDMPGGDRMVSITQMGSIIPLGYDDKVRPEFTLNFRLILEPAASLNTSRESL